MAGPQSLDGDQDADAAPGASPRIGGDERRTIVAASGGLGQQLGAWSGQQLAAED
jgi:hypothetical protein